jgi:hypothetical protein
MRRLAALLLLFSSVGAFADTCDGGGGNGCVQVEQFEAGGTDAPSITLDSNLTAGNGVALILRNTADTAYTGCSDATNGAYDDFDVDIEQGGTSGFHARAFLFLNAAAENQIDCTAGAAIDTRIVAIEFTGFDTLVDVDCVSLDANDPITATDLVAATDTGQLVIEFFSANSAIGIAPGGTETEQDEFGARLQVQDVLTGGAGNISPSWDLGGSEAGIACAAIFAPPADSSVPVIDHHRRQQFN